MDQDIKLIEDAQKDPQKFLLLYDKYFDKIYRYVYRRVNDKETVEDLVSQTFFDALSHLKTFQWRGFPFSSWLYKIAHNNILKWYRDHYKVSTVEISEAHQLVDINANQKEEAMQKEQTEEMRRVLQQLDPDEQEIIRLKYFEEVSNIEIAEIMGLSPNNIGVKIYRTLKKLKQLLKS